MEALLHLPDATLSSRATQPPHTPQLLPPLPTPPTLTPVHYHHSPRSSFPLQRFTSHSDQCLLCSRNWLNPDETLCSLLANHTSLPPLSRSAHTSVCASLAETPSPLFISSASLMLFIHVMKSQRRLRLFSLQKGHKHSQRKCSREKRRWVWTDLKTPPKVSCDWPVDSHALAHTHANAHGLIISSQHSRSETFFL